MAKTVKLGGQAKYLTADVGGKKYDIPLADYMKMPDAREMLNIRRLPAKEREGAYTSFFLSYFERYIGEDAFAELSMNDFEALMAAWNEANEAEASATPGE